MICIVQLQLKNEKNSIIKKIETFDRRNSSGNIKSISYYNTEQNNPINQPGIFTWRVKVIKPDLKKNREITLFFMTPNTYVWPISFHSL